MVIYITIPFDLYEYMSQIIYIYNKWERWDVYKHILEHVIKYMSKLNRKSQYLNTCWYIITIYSVEHKYMVIYITIPFDLYEYMS